CCGSRNSGTSRMRLSNRSRLQPGGRYWSTRLISTVPSHGTPSRCLSESIKRSRWLLTGETGTQEPYITHSVVKRATEGEMVSEMVDRFRSVIVIGEYKGSCQAISKR